MIFIHLFSFRLVFSAVFRNEKRPNDEYLLFDDFHSKMRRIIAEPGKLNGMQRTRENFPIIDAPG